MTFGLGMRSQASHAPRKPSHAEHPKWSFIQVKAFARHTAPTGRQYLHSTHLIKNLCPKSTKNCENSIIRKEPN